jgi:Intracellular proteinase inhibitor
VSASRFWFFLPLLMGAGCSRPLEPGDLQNSAVQDGILYTLSLDAVAYMHQDTLTGQFFVENHSARHRSFTFSHIQQYGFRLKDQYGLVVLSGPNIVSPATSSLELEPDQRASYQLHMLLRDHGGRWMVPGRYTFEVFLLDGDYPAVGVEITIV